MAQQFTLGATCKTLRQSAHPERQHDPHQAKDLVSEGGIKNLPSPRHSLLRVWMASWS